MVPTRRHLSDDNTSAECGERHTYTYLSGVVVYATEVEYSGSAGTYNLCNRLQVRHVQDGDFRGPTLNPGTTRGDDSLK